VPGWPEPGRVPAGPEVAGAAAPAHPVAANIKAAVAASAAVAGDLMRRLPWLCRSPSNYVYSDIVGAARSIVDGQKQS